MFRVAARGLQSRCEHIGPAVIAVGGGSMTIGDGVSERNDGSCVRWREHIDFRHLVPMIHVLRLGERGRGYLVTVDVIGRGARAGMACLLCRWCLQMKRHSEIGERGHGIVRPDPKRIRRQAES